jgi:hypothetical protein
VDVINLAKFHIDWCSGLDPTGVPIVFDAYVDSSPAFGRFLMSRLLFSVASSLTRAVHFTGKTYDDIGQLFAMQV